MEKHDDKYLGFCALYAIDSLEGADLQEFKLHLKSVCDLCGREISEIKETMALLSTALPQISPSQELKERVLFSARLSQVVKGNVAKPDTSAPPPLSQQEEIVLLPKRRQPVLIIWLIIAMILIIVGFGAYIYSLFKSMNEQHKYSIAQQSKIASLVNDLEQKNAVIDFLESPNVDIVILKGSDIDPPVRGKIFWDLKTGEAILHVSGLPVVSLDKVYQLWASIRKKPYSVGTFSITSSSKRENFFKVMLPNVTSKEEIEEFFITSEVKGGSAILSGEKYLSSLSIIGSKK